MAYKFLPASMYITGQTPKETWTNSFQELLNQQFANSTTLFTIQEETALGSGIYQSVDVRVNSAVESKTGTKLGDDFKTILFQDLGHATGLGYLYYFDNNYWIVINSEIIKNLAATCTVRRCNNVLRWVDTSGGYHSQPCSIDYALTENTDYKTSKSALVEPKGTLSIVTQFNNQTNLIKPNARFLFGNTGNWFGYKVQGGGIGNFNNLSTLDNMSSGLLHMTLVADYVNTDTDDLVSGIADIKSYSYTISIDNGNVGGIVGQTIQLTATIKQSGQAVTMPVTWSSSDATIASVSTSGLLTMVKTGSCTISCVVDGNVASTSITATVSGTPASNYQIVITPSSNFVYQGRSVTYTAYLYLNGAQQANTFTFSVVPTGIPADNYVFDIVDGNNFTITNNEMYLASPLSISCVSGSHSKTFDILLKGSW